MVATALRRSLESACTPEYNPLRNEGMNEESAQDAVTGAFNIMVDSAGSSLVQNSNGYV